MAAASALVRSLESDFSLIEISVENHVLNGIEFLCLVILQGLVQTVDLSLAAE